MNPWKYLTDELPDANTELLVSFEDHDGERRVVQAWFDGREFSDAYAYDVPRVYAWAPVPAPALHAEPAGRLNPLIV